MAELNNEQLVILEAMGALAATAAEVDKQVAYLRRHMDRYAPRWREARTFRAALARDENRRIKREELARHVKGLLAKHEKEHVKLREVEDNLE